MNFQAKYVDNFSTNWTLYNEKYRKGILTRCNYGKDRDIDEFDPKSYYGFSSSDFDSSEDGCGYEEGKRGPHAIGSKSLKMKVRELLRDNYDESDSDEHKRWEKQKRYNKKRHKKYKKMCQEFPSQFHKMDICVIITICSYLGEPQNILHFLSSEKCLSKFRNNYHIWKQCFEAWYCYKAQDRTNSRLNLCKFESSFRENPLSEGAFTFKGLIWNHFELMKSFCWKEIPIQPQASRIGNDYSHDRISGVHCYNKILLDYSQQKLQVKLIFVPEDSYFLLVLSENKLQVYKMNTGKEKELELCYSTESLNFLQCRLSHTSPEYLIIMKDQHIERINLLEISSMSDHEGSQHICSVSELEGEESLKNFVICNQTELMLQTSENLKIFDINSEKIVFSAKMSYPEKKSSLGKIKAIDHESILILNPENEVCMVDTREGRIRSITDDKISSFDINGNDIYCLSQRKICFYNLDLRMADSEIEINGELNLKFYDRDPYEYIKADRHRIGLMSQNSLIFSNHGEINQTMGKEVVNYSRRPTNSLDFDLKCKKYPSDPLQLCDFDYFDRFYCTATRNVIQTPETPNYVELFEVKPVNSYLI
ncbi:unnamed protein product [Moneuplotes crassus]|uniref:Uncharacterized protein n=1 Tax=Euplotes crassus TaxID=5936 RepID=A0AAD1U385_EUPCR|nr:unnamed protein product [Moneuplotes crassus]